MASSGNGVRRCCSWPGCPPRLRFLPSLRGGLGGLTISLEGGLEEVDEFLRAAANRRLSCSFSCCRRTFSSSSSPSRADAAASFASAAASFSSIAARRRASDLLSEPGLVLDRIMGRYDTNLTRSEQDQEVAVPRESLQTQDLQNAGAGSLQSSVYHPVIRLL